MKTKDKVIKYSEEVLRIDHLHKDIIYLIDLTIEEQNKLWFDFIDKWFDNMRKSNDLWRLESRDDIEGLLMEALTKEFGE